MAQQTPALDRAARDLCLADTDAQVHELSHEYPCAACVEEAQTAVSAALEVDEMAALIWETSRRDEGTISATGAKHVAQTLRAHLLGEAS